jgi:putative chitinase
MNLDKLNKTISLELLPLLSEAMEKFQINTPLRIAHFLSQAMHESGNFKRLEEGLNYGAEGLLNNFKKYFIDKTNKPLADVNAYARKPQMIASHVYANRMGNGDEASQEGWKFRGRGFMQITGKGLYTEFGKSIGEDLVANPDIVVTPKYAALSAAWFFGSKGCIQIADKGPTPDVVKQVTFRINGGYNGLDERQANFNTLWPLLST